MFASERVQFTARRAQIEWALWLNCHVVSNGLYPADTFGEFGYEAHLRAGVGVTTDYYVPVYGRHTGLDCAR